MPFYHFTDERNIDSIRQYGLMSWYQLNRNKIVYYPASNRLSRSLDVSKNLQDYVHLTLSPKHPMAIKAQFEGRVKSLVWLTIDEAVCKRNLGVLYSNMNSTANLATINDDPRTALTSANPQAEVLVARFIEPQWITFPSDWGKVLSKKIRWPW